MPRTLLITATLDGTPLDAIDVLIPDVAAGTPTPTTPTPTTPTPTTPTPTPTGGEVIVVKPGVDWRSLKAGTAYELDAGDYRGPGEISLPAGITLAAREPGRVVIRGDKGKPNLWGTGGAGGNLTAGLTLVDLVFDGGGWGKYNHEAAVRTGDGWRLVRVTVRNSGGTGINIEGDDVESEGLVAEDNAASGRGGKVDGYVELNAVTRRNNRLAKDGDGSSKFTKSKNVRIVGLKSYDNTGAGLWLDGNKGDFVIEGCEFYGQVARKPADDESTGRGLYVEYQLAGKVLVTGCVFHGNQGAGLDVAESPDVTVRDNTFEAGLSGSKFAAVGIQLRDIKRDIGSNRLQRLLVSNNAFLGTSITRDKSSQAITLAKNAITVTNDNVFSDGASVRVPG